MKTPIMALCGTLLLIPAARADQMSWAIAEDQAYDMDLGIRDYPDWDVRPQLAYFDNECLRPYGCPAFENIRKALVSISPKRRGVPVYQLSLDLLKDTCGQ